MSNRRADRVWMRMSQWYGARWIENFGPKPPEDWVRAVNAASDDQMQAALSAIRSRHLSHPPTLPEFEAALRESRTKTAAHAAELPPPVTDYIGLFANRALLAWLMRKGPVAESTLPSIIAAKDRIAGNFRVIATEEPITAEELRERLFAEFDRLAHPQRAAA